MSRALLLPLTLLAGLAGWSRAEACTNFLVSRGASRDGSTLPSHSSFSVLITAERGVSGTQEPV